ncbi:hypothetical protein SAMN05444266_102190 [Chitinophaga jiangningensis]|uniref:Uncharacterized protein n=1 Tax=Chitinophaga jiangningensis TaxID=1419482 RepID=A0A1M6Y832_9BACT|nr:hypothetical protein [Chitinophaga jiangningensis]SHL14292.1 hypothetical protein SAMN05444266_102190 [Chitinophaga jiangningensis]
MLLKKHPYWKTVVIIWVIISSFYSASCQSTKSDSDPKEQKSKAELFSNKSGSLIQKQFIDIGSLRGCQIKVVQLTDLIGGETTKAVRFEYIYPGAYSSDTKIGILDIDEVDALIKSLNILKDKVIPTTPELYTEIAYKSRGGFQAGCFISRKQWSSFLKLEQFDDKSYVFMKDGDIIQLLSLLNDAKAKF